MLRWLKEVFSFQRRPLSAVQPRPARHARKTPLGLEAVNFDIVDRAQRRNQALERVNGARFLPGGRAMPADIETRPAFRFEDDAQYAQRYHKAFQNRDERK